MATTYTLTEPASVETVITSIEPASIGTTINQIEPIRGFGQNPFGDAGVEGKEYGRGFGDPITSYLTNNED